MKFLRSHIRWQLSFLFGALFGAFIFLILYGFGVLNVQNEDWLLTGWYDLSQHYVGWKLYRASGWHFPIGLCDTSFYPYLASVIYTDSIPLVSLFFKILSPVLPETFQFFGWYGLFCFMMQGGISKLILRRITTNEASCFICSIPFVYCAPVWQRMYYHTALASHYLILLAIMLFMYRDRIDSMVKRIICWCVLGMLCITIHFTIYGIVSVMLVGYALLESLLAERKKVPVMILYIASYLAATLFAFYLFGGFYGNISGASDGLGVYSANLNSLFNPIDYSLIIKEFPLIECQYEGLSYVGIMSMVLLVPASAYIFTHIREIWSSKKEWIISISVTAFILVVIALSPKVSFGSHVLYEIPLPEFIFNAWSLFRASGRFLWPVMYLVILLSIYYSRFGIRKYYPQLIIFACILQLYEFTGKVYEISDTYRSPKKARYSADMLDLYDFGGISHVQFMHDYYFGEFYGDEVRDQMIGYTQFALRHGMTVSNFHFSRDDMDLVRERISECEEKLEMQEGDKDTMYVFRTEDVSLEELRKKYPDMYDITTENEIILTSERLGGI